MKFLSNDERFHYALDYLLQDEGGYTNELDDRGGETKFGITQSELNKYHSKLGLPAKVIDLTRENAATYYKKIWWDRYNYNLINDIKVATKIFDLAVNIGATEAHKITQEALSYNGYSIILIDGILGNKTIACINEVCRHGRDVDLLNDIREDARLYYEHLIEINPRLKKFENGWLVRAMR